MRRTPRLLEGLARLWRMLRQLSGDDAYERYLDHCRRVGSAHPPILNRAEFERQRLQHKWSRINRCC